MTRDPPISHADYAIRSIREDLVAGRLQPGERVAAERLATDLGISHVPVREAIRFLEAQGHLERDRHGRASVPLLSEVDADEIFQLRSLLEQELHETAVPLLKPSDFEDLRAWQERMEAAIRSKDLAAYTRSNRAFHFVAFRRSGSTWAMRFLDALWDASARYQTAFLQQHGWQEQMEDHARLVSAFLAGDLTEVHKVANHHRQATVQAARRAAAAPAGQLGAQGLGK